MPHLNRQSFLKASICLFLLSALAVSVHHYSINTGQPADGLAASSTPYGLTGPEGTRADAATQARLAASYLKLPLSFEENRGQTDGRVKFLSRGDGYLLFLTPQEATLSLRQPLAEKVEEADAAMASHAKPSRASAEVLKMKFVGANPSALEQGEEESTAKSNYFRGNDPARWQTNVPNFSRVRFLDVYPGVDLVYYGNQRQLEYDFIVAPGTDPSQIKLSFEGAEKVYVNETGNLVLSTKTGEVQQHKPVIYQTTGGARTEIAGHYALNKEGQVRFVISEYDRLLPLVIDPILSYSTYLGGTFPDFAASIAVDSAGNAYATGGTISTDFPIGPGFQQTGAQGFIYDAYVTKLNPSGSAIIYSTYLGGDSGDDYSTDIAVDSSGRAYVSGIAYSNNFPLVNPIQSVNKGGGDSFIARLNATGSALEYSTYIGGTDFDQLVSLAVDQGGSAYLTGNSNSSDFPTLNPIQAARKGNTIFKSTDAGANWSTSDNGIIPPVVNKLVIDSISSPNRIYAGTQRGLYRSTDGGSNWAALGAGQITGRVKDVAFDKANPNILYAAVEEMAGIYKSTDGGASWSLSNTGLIGVPKVVVIDPVNSSLIYVGTNGNGVWKSANGGANWSQSNGSPQVLSSAEINALVIDPNNPSVIYAATRNSIYKSTNAGGSWTRNTSSVVNFMNAHALVMSPADSSTLYALSGSRGIAKSTDSGVTWTRIGTQDFGQPQFSLAIDPTNPNTLYVGSNQGLYKSTDGGVNWTRVSDELVYTVAINPSQPSTIYVGAYNIGDAVVLKLNQQGTALQFSTYLGGDDGDSASAIAVDSSNNIYLAGTTGSGNFPTASPLQATKLAPKPQSDAFITKLNAAGSLLVYSTYLGGSLSTSASGIAVDSVGSVYLTGSTSAQDFPLLNPLRSSRGPNAINDAFITKLNTAGSALVYSTYLGGDDSSDVGRDIAVDAAGNAYVTGTTSSESFPTVAPVQATRNGLFSDAFVTVINSTGSVYLFSTYFGGGNSEEGVAIALSPDGGVYITGTTSSTNLPTANALRPNYSGEQDAFVAKLSQVVPQATPTPTPTPTPSPTPVSLNISGRVTTTGGTQGVSGVTMTVNMRHGDTVTSTITTQTDQNGNYSFLNLPLGQTSAEIRPSKAGYNFEPTGKIFVSSSSVSGSFMADFTAIPNTIQFSQPSYTFNEATVNTPQGFGSLKVNVVRTDTTSAATVQYFTSDQSGGNECNQVTGQASQRCDYATQAGTLRFAAGEGSKTIQIPIINDGYLEGNESFKITLGNPTGGAMIGANNEATITIEDRGVITTPTENPYLNNEFFVRMNYLDFLAREPDAEGWNTWPTVLNNCGPEKGFLGAPKSCDRAFVSHGFVASPEFTDRGYLIYRMYEVGLLRLPRYSEFVPDMAAMSGAPGSQELAQNTAQFAESFSARQDFINKFGDVSSQAQAAQLVARLEQNAGVTLPESTTTLPGQPTQYNRQDLINKRASGEFSLGQTLKAFVEQKVVYDRFFERGFVTMMYFGFLKRDPDLNDPNLAGWTEWVFVFTNGGAQRNRPDIGVRDIHHLIFGFIYSEEYRKRFGQP